MTQRGGALGKRRCCEASNRSLSISLTQQQAYCSGVSARQRRTKKLTFRTSAIHGKMGWHCTQTHPRGNHLSLTWIRSCALLHRHRPDLLDWNKLDKSDPHACTKLAFTLAERHLNIPQLLEVADICDVARPDERSVMTYIAQYFHAFTVAGE